MTDTAESGGRCRYIHCWDRSNNRTDRDSQYTDSPNKLKFLDIPVDPPYLKIAEKPINNLGLPVKQYYTTGDICKVLAVKPDTFRARLRVAKYPEPIRVAGKRRFSEEEVRNIIQTTAKLKGQRKEGREVDSE